MDASHKSMKARLQSNSGIALGPILFIIAILAILAAAIAAGSGSFNASTAAEGNKAKASSIIQIGDNLKTGMDRLTMENSVAPGGWVIAPANTSNTVDLFSPTGGGIAAPSIAMAGNPASDVWAYPLAAIPNIGTYSTNASNTLQLAVLNVAAGVCQEINNRANGQNVAPTALALGNFSLATTIAPTTNGAWPATANTTMVNLYGKPVGCVNNSTAGGTGVPAGYYFYEVLYVQ